MKKIIAIVITLFAFIPVAVYAAGCTPTIDKNGYCDIDGEYHDPSFSEINKNKCKENYTYINKYCSMSCREDAHTYFPNKVPYLSLDQYDSILGGNHFRWEEIKTDSKIECRTTVDYDKWLEDFKEVTLQRTWTPSSGIIHSIQEMHQRYTDVELCDLWTYVKTGSFPSGYSSLTKNYWLSLGSTEVKIILAALAFTDGITWDNCDKCNQKTQTETRKLVRVTNYLCSAGVCNQNALQAQVDKDLKAKGYTKYKNYLFYDPAKYHGEYTSTASSFSKHVDLCFATKNGVTAPVKISKIGDCKDITTTTGSGNYRIYNTVTGADLGNYLTLKSSGYNEYCPAKGEKPYNSEGWDIYWDEATKSPATGTGNSTYMQSVDTMQAEINKLLSAIKTCTTKSDSLAKKSNSTSIVVNYKDPMKVYSRNVKLNRKTIKSDNNRKVNAAAEATSGLTWRSCNTLSASALKQAFENSLKTGKPVTIECPRIKLMSYNSYLNRSITYTQEATYKYEMPKNTYNYILKTTGQAVDKVTGDDAKYNRYIEIGYPNYPVYFTTPTGTYPIGLTYTNIGWNGHLVKEATYTCEYKVVNRVVCDNPPCEDTPDDENPPTPNPPSNPKNPGVNLIYRPISLTNPFPGENAKNMVSETGRKSGSNWTKDNIKNYITNNRGVTQNEVYNKTPLYSFTLDASAIRNIRAYNKTTDYNDFNLTCNKKYGKRCISTFLKNVQSYGVQVNANTCWNKGQTQFYSCANITQNQDNIKCYVKKGTKELNCVDCMNAENKKKYAVCMTS